MQLLWTSSSVALPSGLMYDKSDLPMEEEECERNLAYTPPAQKSLEEIQEMDKDDESLVKYKQTLLGSLRVNAGGFASGFSLERSQNQEVFHPPATVSGQSAAAGAPAVGVS